MTQMEMTMHNYKRSLLSLTLFAIAGSAHAYTFYLDNFAVLKNYDASPGGTPAGVVDLIATKAIFADNFDDGAQPPAAPNFTVYGGGGATSYAMLGSMGPETTGAQGILNLNSTGAVDNGSGTPVQQAILKTNVDPASTAGLKQDSTDFAVGGVFNLVNPGNANGAYGVRFTDAGEGNGNDIVSLSVRGRADGQALIQFSRFNSITGIGSMISQQVLDTDHDQIALGLTYLDPDGVDPAPKAVYASYFYVDGGTPSATFIGMAGSANLFHGENFTRAAFFAADTAPVPEPAGYALMLAGLGLVGWKIRCNRT